MYIRAAGIAVLERECFIQTYLAHIVYNGDEVNVIMAQGLHIPTIPELWTDAD